MVLNLSQTAIAGSVLISCVCALLGCVLILQRRSLLVDMLGHAVFPGVLLGFLAASWTRNIYFFSAGAIICLFLGLLCFRWLSSSEKIGSDSATAISLSGTFAIGAVLLSWILQHSTGAHSGLNTFLVGQAALISIDEVYAFVALLFCCVTYFLLFSKKIKFMIFDPQYSKVSGLYSGPVETGLYVLIAMSVFWAVKSVGVVLASALFVLAPAAALLWTGAFYSFLFLALVISATGTYVGAYWSTADARAPTGAAIIVVLFAVFIFSFLFGTKGLVRRKIESANLKLQHLIEDYLKTWFYFKEANSLNPQEDFVLWKEVSKRLPFLEKPFNKFLFKVLGRKYLQSSNSEGYKLNKLGQNYSVELVRRHRVWESYLVSKMDYKPDHVHDEAELVEHLMDPQMTQKIQNDLGIDKDPHGKDIPAPTELAKLLKEQK